MNDRADALWRRLAGMFGAETLARKFGETPPDEWRISLSRLTDSELQKGLRRLTTSGKGHVPTLPEFLRMCREVGGDYEDPVPPSNRLAAPPVPRWSEQANLHLLAHFKRQVLRNVHYVTERMRQYPMPATDHESAAIVQPLVDAKNAWAQDMREREECGELPKDGGKALWAEYIENAEKAVAWVRANEAVA